MHGGIPATGLLGGTGPRPSLGGACSSPGERWVASQLPQLARQLDGHVDALAHNARTARLTADAAARGA
jgi:hypothetical protein